MTNLLQHDPVCHFVDTIQQQASGVLFALKERHEINSNLLLFCYWFTVNQQGLLSKLHIKQLLSAIHPWHQKVIIPLQKLCHQIKAAKNVDLWTLEDVGYEDAVELLSMAEYFELQLISDLIVKKSRGSRTTAVQKIIHTCLNISSYCQAAHIFLDERDYEYLSTIMLIVFPEIEVNKTIALVRHTLSEERAKEPLQKNLWFGL